MDEKQILNPSAFVILTTIPDFKTVRRAIESSTNGSGVYVDCSKIRTAEDFFLLMDEEDVGDGIAADNGGRDRTVRAMFTSWSGGKSMIFLQGFEKVDAVMRGYLSSLWRDGKHSFYPRCPF